MPGMPGTFSPAPQVSDHDMHHGACGTHVPWCMPGSLSSGGDENVPGILGTCTTRNFTCLVRGPSNGNILSVTGHLCGGIHRSLVNSPHKSQRRRALVFSLICAWTNGWVNNRDAGYLRRHRAHYDAIVMFMYFEMITFRTVIRNIWNMIK